MKEELPNVKKNIYTTTIKRFLDIIFSGLAILALSPLFVLLACLELVFHGYPILYCQERPGVHGEIFKIYKFRSMTNEKDENGELLASEQRLTPFGKFIRRFSLDELPELFCVFKGDMSFIGPRPLLVKYLPYYSQRHMMRHEMRPGFACVPLEKHKTWTWNDQFENDIWYVENCSFIIDLKMIFAVMKEAFIGNRYRVDDTRTEFNGDNLFEDAINEREQ